MWLAALNMPGFSYQTDALILPVDFHILGPRVASDILMQMGMQVPFHTAWCLTIFWHILINGKSQFLVKQTSISAEFQASHLCGSNLHIFCPGNRWLSGVPPMDPTFFGRMPFGAWTEEDWRLRDRRQPGADRLFPHLDVVQFQWTKWIDSTRHDFTIVI